MNGLSLPRFARRRGLTLVELVVVMAILLPWQGLSFPCFQASSVVRRHPPELPTTAKSTNGFKPTKLPRHPTPKIGTH